MKSGFVFSFIVGAWLAILFWGSLAPTSEHTRVALGSIPASVEPNVCLGYYNGEREYPIAVYRIEKEASYSLYEITCHSGIKQRIGW